MGCVFGLFRESLVGKRYRIFEFMAKDLWTKEQLIVGLAQYCQMPFGKIHARNPDIISLGKLIGRTAGACSRKLGNFSRLDPELKKRNVQGLRNGAKLDIAVWEEYMFDREKLVIESEYLKEQFRKRKTDFSLSQTQEIIRKDKETERFAQIKQRVGQSFFRNELLSCYKNQCCVSGVSDSRLLIASHILKWSEHEDERLNPKNGLLLNAFHDKCFELGMFTIDQDFRILVNPKVEIHNKFMEENLSGYDGKEIALPERERAIPDIAFLKDHRLTRFDIFTNP